MSIFVLFFALALAGCTLASPRVFRTLSVGDTTVRVELARTPEERSKGLSGRAGIRAEEGMLFLFETKGFHQFWMKEMQFPIDIIWINDNKVVDISPNIPPPKEGETTLRLYRPKSPVDKVLEVQANFALSHGVSVGDKIELTGD